VCGDRVSRNSLTRNIRFPAGGYNLSNSKSIVLYVQLMLTHEKVEFLGSEIMQNLLSVTVHLPALQNIWSLQNIILPLYMALP
jgi:hypothetical protein